MNFKPYAKIGKDALNRMLMAHPNISENKEVMDVKYLIDLNNKCNCHCFKCPLVKAAIKEKERYCAEYCNSFKKYTWSDVEITDDGVVVKSNKNLSFGSSSHRLSKLSLLFFISLHFCSSIDRNGIIKNLDFREIAEKLNCNVRSISNSAKSLVKYGFIWISKISTYKYSVKIVPYTTYHLTAREGGMGYLQITEDVLDKLISLKEVNYVRTTISIILDQDEARLKENKIQKKNETEEENVSVDSTTIKGKITLGEIRKRLPKYISYMQIINVINKDKLNEMIDWELKDDKLYYSVKDKYNIDKYKESIKEQYLIQISNYLNKSKVYSETIDKDDLLQMGLQYSIDVVLRYLPIAEEQILDQDYTGNYCGFLRNIINQGYLDTKYSKAI